MIYNQQINDELHLRRRIILSEWTGVRSTHDSTEFVRLNSDRQTLYQSRKNTSVVLSLNWVWRSTITVELYPFWSSHPMETSTWSHVKTNVWSNPTFQLLTTKVKSAFSNFALKIEYGTILLVSSIRPRRSTSLCLGLNTGYIFNWWIICLFYYAYDKIRKVKRPKRRKGWLKSKLNRLSRKSILPSQRRL